jgi:uncharacterized damage-inducible protein DinB
MSSVTSDLESRPDTAGDAERRAVELLTTTPAALLFTDISIEHAATRRLLERVPDGSFDWRPHERSRSLGELATHVADIPNRGLSILTTDELDVMQRVPVAPATTTAELLARHDESTSRLKAALDAASLATLLAPWTMRRGSDVVVSAPRHLLVRRVMMSHLVHHRAQLGVYLRLLGVPLVGMYGPSADE